MYVIIEIDHGRAGGRYGNNILVICCLAGASIELRSRDVPAPHSKLLGVCLLPTVINALIQPLVLCSYIYLSAL